MSVPYSKIIDLLGRWASNELPILNFTVNNVMEAIGLSETFYDDVFKYLIRMDGFELNAKKMLLCPRGHKGRTFSLHEPIDEEELFQCWCGEHYYYEPDSTIITFCFSDGFVYEQQLKKNFKHDRTPCHT